MAQINAKFTPIAESPRQIDDEVRYDFVFQTGARMRLHSDGPNIMGRHVMTAPKLSICIPTRNRARYLRSLLDRLSGEVAGFPFDCEVLVSDNASTDDTQAVLSDAASSLPLRSFRHESDVGSFQNLMGLYRAATGDYILYLADDDILLPEGVVRAVGQMDYHTEAAALYAPWSLMDLHKNTSGGLFYTQPEDVVIKQGNYTALVVHVLNHVVFSEIAILRREHFLRINPGTSDFAFWAFTMPCEYLGVGDLIYAAEPFYGSVTCHDEEDDRVQAGLVQVETGWDLYRGGLEYMLGLALRQGGLTDPSAARAAVERLVIQRMQVALRLRLASERNPVENYYLAARLRGLGAELGVPVTFDQVRGAAALHYMAIDLPQKHGASRVALLGDVNDETLATFQKKAEVEAVSLSDVSDVAPGDVVFEFGSTQSHSPIVAERALATMTEADLLRKFA